MAGQRRAVLTAALVAGSLGGGLLVSANPAGAIATETLYVRTGASGTTCTATTPCPTIQDAVTVADAESGTVLITVGPNTSPSVYAGNITIAASGLTTLTVQGAGPAATVVSGNSSTRVFNIAGGTVTIAGLAIDSGSAAVGGGVHVSPGVTATLTDDTFSGDHATLSGGAIYNTGEDGHATATLTDDTFSGDHATLRGGAIFNGAVGSDGHATATLTDDTFSGDHATNTGGAIFNTGVEGGHATATLTDDTFSGDHATLGGGAIYNTGVDVGHATATLTDDTFSGDDATLGGGAIYNTGEAGTATATFTASIFDGSSCSNTSGTLSGTYDVVTTTSSGCTSFTSSKTTVTPATLHLATSLGTNTAPSAPKTLALGPASAAIDVVPSSVCQSSIDLPGGGTFTLNTDERGFPRPGNPAQTSCDAGAYELQPSAPAFTSPGVAKFPHRVDSTFTITTSGSPAATITERGTLPRGLSFTTLGNGDATISGTPSPRDKRSYSIRLTATNGVSSPAMQRLTIDIGTRPVY